MDLIRKCTNANPNLNVTITLTLIGFPINGVMQTSLSVRLLLYMVLNRLEFHQRFEKQFTLRALRRF